MLLFEASPGNACPYEYTLPDKIKDGWETASLSSEKIDPDPIKQLFAHVENGDYENIVSVLIVRNGKLVAEEYFPRQEGDQRELGFGEWRRRRQHLPSKVSPQS